tara:strand:+ start:1206 stop:1358 length:153 start_codon:yes stop_codon:yes gene_type:complete
MPAEPFLFIIAPLFLFILGVVLISSYGKAKNKTLIDSYKIIDDLEKKYIY